MQNQTITRTAAATAATVMAAAASAAEDKPASDQPIDKAFEALKTFDWGTDYRKNERNQEKKYQDALGAIDAAVLATHGDAAGRKGLEARLAAVLPTGVSRAAKDFICRKLTIVGTAESVPALAALLPDKDLSHMARYALERIPAPKRRRPSARPWPRPAVPRRQG